jgi:hypothetical protein
MITDPDPEKARRASEAMFTMKKLDIAALQRAYAGGWPRPAKAAGQAAQS